MSDKPTIFISYSRDDHKAKDFVVSHLDILAEHRGFQIWHDRAMVGGDAWKSEVDRQLNRCIFAIFLVSRNSLNSVFIRDVELPVLRARQASEGLRLYPILIESCPWQEVPWLKELNIRPACETPLTEVDDATRNPLMTEITKEVGALLADASNTPIKTGTRPTGVGKDETSPPASGFSESSKPFDFGESDESSSATPTSPPITPYPDQHPESTDLVGRSGHSRAGQFPVEAGKPGGAVLLI